MDEDINLFQLHICTEDPCLLMDKQLAEKLDLSFKTVYINEKFYC